MTGESPRAAVQSDGKEPELKRSRRTLIKIKLQNSQRVMRYFL